VDADVEKESVTSTAHFIVRTAGAVFTYHKSVLTARLAPSGQLF
jgi:hypothetical protein